MNIAAPEQTKSFTFVKRKINSATKSRVIDFNNAFWQRKVIAFGGQLFRALITKHMKCSCFIFKQVLPRFSKLLDYI